MTVEQQITLMLACGCLNDIAEKLEDRRDKENARQVKQVQKKIEDLILEEDPKLKQSIKS